VHVNVAFDATLWDEPTTGIGLYTRSLCQALAREGAQVRRLGARESGDAPRGRLSASAHTALLLPWLLARGKDPLFHAVCNFNLPLWRVANVRFVLTVHDLIPELLPHTVSARFRWQFRTWLKRSLKVADRVICDSEHTRNDLLARFSVARERTFVVPLGVDHVYEALADERRLTAPVLQTLPPSYVLYAGALDARKNVSLLLDAMQHLRSRRCPATLVLAGQRWFGAGPVEKRIAQMRSEGFDLHVLGYQPPGAFYEVIRRASVFVFPSRYEGFGLPPLEAMALGVPTVISTAASLPEVCGPAAVQVGPEDSEGLAVQLERLLASPAERFRLGEEGKRHAARFTWEKAAKATLEVYRSALEGLP
jgi:glycosyltransferase involved in cell wall biosynthesis